MGMFDDVGNFFGKVGKAELTEVDKVQYVEDLLRENLRDLAFSRDDIYADALKDKVIFMVRPGEEKLKKFKSGENTYISIPSKIYDELDTMDDFDQYHHLMDTAMLSMAAEEFRETNESGDLNTLEAELIDKAVKKVEDFSGETLAVKDDIEYDDFGQPEKLKDDKQLFEPKKYAAVKADGTEETDEDDDAAKEAKESCDSDEHTSSSGTVNVQEINDEADQDRQEMKDAAAQREYHAEYTSQSITDTDQKTFDEVKGSVFDYNHYGDEAIIDPKTKSELNRYVADITKALSGYDGKVKRLNPAKRLSAKDICNDISDKIYIGKSYVDGKFIDQNIVVDCSGSMCGSPIEDAIKLCYVFNKLAQNDLLEGSIVLTESGQNMAITMPVHDSIIEQLGGTGGGEGLTKTLNKHKDLLRGKNVIVMTDGDLVEEPIPNDFWQKGRMSCIGMYINKSVKYEDLPGYDKGMNRWFPRTIIRNSFEEGVQKLIQLGLKASKK